MRRSYSGISFFSHIRMAHDLSCPTKYKNGTPPLVREIRFRFVSSSCGFCPPATLGRSPQEGASKQVNLASAIRIALLGPSCERIILFLGYLDGAHNLDFGTVGQAHSKQEATTSHLNFAHQFPRPRDWMPLPRLSVPLRASLSKALVRSPTFHKYYSSSTIF